MTPTDFVRAHTSFARPPLVAEFELTLATEITPIWQASEAWLARHQVAPPYWAFAWPGGQALARHVLDHPSLVSGLNVLDFAAGCGLAALACARAGARVEACDIDPLAAAAMALNAARNQVDITITCADLVGSTCRWDMILCGDVCYEAPMARHILPWLRLMAREAVVLMADPGRAYVPTQGLTRIASYEVPTSTELEDRASRQVTLSRLDS